MTGSKRNPVQNMAGTGSLSKLHPVASAGMLPPSDLPVLIVSGELECRLRFANAAHLRGLRPVCCSSVNDARALLAREGYSLALCSEALSDGHYPDVVQAAGSRWPRVPVVVFSRIANWAGFVRAVGAGAFDYIASPKDPREAARALISALNLVHTPDPPTGTTGAAA
jgi:DNA-binding NtrC family response regulator